MYCICPTMSSLNSWPAYHIFIYLLSLSQCIQWLAFCTLYVCVHTFHFCMYSVFVCMCVCLCINKVTSAGIVLDQELVQGHPAPSDPHHDRTAQDTHQPQLLRVTKLTQQRRGETERNSVSSTKYNDYWHEILRIQSHYTQQPIPIWAKVYAAPCKLYYNTHALMILLNHLLVKSPAYPTI